MQKQTNKFNGSLIIGLLIGSVAGMIFGAAITELFSRITGKNWGEENERESASRQVDPRWLLQ